MTSRKPTDRRVAARPIAAPDRRRKRAEASDFHTLIDGAIHGILVHHNFRPLYANPSFAEILGYDSADEIMALPILRPFFPNDVWPRIETECDELLRGDKEKIVERIRILKKDGKEIWVAITVRKIAWSDQDAMMVTAIDVTAKVEIEQSLLISEQRLRSILEILPYPIYISRREDGQVLFVNRKTCLLFQQSAGQFLRQKSTELFVDPKDREGIEKLFKSVTDVRDIEVPMKTGQGREFIAELAAILLEYGGSQAFLVALNDISQRKQMEAELFRQASTDSLTGISNRRYFQNVAEQELRRARRFTRDLTVMMIDIDHFKPINDTYGHAAGDSVIQGVVKRSLESLRQTDSIGRMGGEEFAVVLPETSLKAAFDVADRLRAHIKEKPIIADQTPVACSVSIGVAQLAPQDSGIDDLLRRSDLALYKAKNNGRNRVEIAPAPPPMSDHTPTHPATKRKKKEAKE